MGCVFLNICYNENIIQVNSTRARYGGESRRTPYAYTAGLSRRGNWRENMKKSYFLLFLLLLLTVSAASAQDDDTNPGAAVFEFTAGSGSYSSCGDEIDVSFSFTVKNSGTAEETVNITELSYDTGSTDDESAPSIAFTCVLQSDSEASCDPAALTLAPGDSAVIEGSYTPETAITAESTTITVSDDADVSFTITASRTDICAGGVIVEPDAENKLLSADFSTDTAGSYTLSVTLTNQGADAVDITPGTVYQHSSAYQNYTDGVGQFVTEEQDEQEEQKDTFAVKYNEAFELPAQTSVILSLPMTYDAAALAGKSANVNWNFTVDTAALNVTGTVDFPAKDDDPVTDPTDPEEPPVTVTVTVTETAAATEPEKPIETVIETPAPNDTESFGSNQLTMYSLVEPEVGEVKFAVNGTSIGSLPATGFSTKHAAKLPAQPAALEYRDLKGLRIQIPSLSVSAELRGVPFADGEWAVEWLGADAGLLDNGVEPGKGTAVIAAHNHIDDMSVGPFVFIRELQNNDRIFITDDDGTMLMYRVYANKLVTPDAADAVYENTIPGSLVLVTCEDEMAEGGYAHRRLVYAEPLQ